MPSLTWAKACYLAGYRKCKGSGWRRDVLGAEAARAFLRHAFGHYYRHLSYVDFNQQQFVWQRVYRDTLISFRDAALRYAGKIRLLHTSRRFTHQTDTAPRPAYERFNAFLTIDYPQGHGHHAPEELSLSPRD